MTVQNVMEIIGVNSCGKPLHLIIRLC